MKLYDGGRAANPRRVRIFLAEKGISVPLEPVDIATKQHRTESFAAINPMQRLPALELDDGTVIAESIAICRYIEEIHPQPPLFGTGALERAEVEMWQRRVEFNLLATIAQVYRHAHPSAKILERPQVPDWAESNRSKALVAMERFDEALRDRTFIAGENFSVADITGLVALDFVRPAR